jgi:hypothetical protein
MRLPLFNLRQQKLSWQTELSGSYARAVAVNRAGRPACSGITAAVEVNCWSER